MPFWRIVPPPPRPWAQSVAPAGWQGRVPRQSRPPCHSAGAAARTHTRAPSPQGAGSQPKWQHSTNTPPIITHASQSTIPKGLNFYRAQTTNAPPVIAPYKSPSAPPILGAVGSPCGMARAGPTAKPPALPLRRGCRPHPSRAPSPRGGGLPTDWGNQIFQFFVQGTLGISPRTPAFKIERRHLDYCRG